MADDKVVDREDVLLALAYCLLAVANVVSLSGYPDGSWAVVPIWLALAGYAASAIKALATGERGRKFERVSWLAWFIFYSASLFWPLDIHWYDALAALSLFNRNTPLGNTMLTLYYLFSASTYAGAGDVLQVAGRMMLVALLATDIKELEEAP